MPQPHRPQPRPPADAAPGPTDATPPGAPPARALDGILVADFSRVLAGPLAAATLAGQSGVRPSGYRPQSRPDGQSPSEYRPVRDAGLP